jgi:Zn-dependent protease with chaperone function
MTGISAVYYDGRTARGQAVTLEFDSAGNLEITGLDQPLRYSAGELRVSPRVGSVPRSIALPDGGKCETDANDAVDAVLARRGAAARSRLLHRLESHWPYILALFVVTVGVVWAVVRFGVPELARQAAYAMPVSADQSLGRGVLEALDRGVFAPSRVERERRDRLQAQFGEIVRGQDARYRFRLEFRASPLLGPNAIALPDGTIVVTDELVRLAEHEEELLAVLAHEIGHVLHRHALRRVLQSSAVALIVAFATGDVFSLTALAAALPTMLIEAKFSRDFEREADDYALRFLRENRISPQRVATILRRLAEHRGDKQERFGYLSSHPATDERIRMFSAER